MMESIKNSRDNLRAIILERLSKQDYKDLLSGKIFISRVDMFLERTANFY